MAHALAVPTRVRLLELLRAAEAARGVADLAAAVGLHVNTVRSHLEQLVEAGLAIRSVERPSGPGRPNVVYRSSQRPLAAGDQRLSAPAEDPYRDLAAALVAELAVNAAAESQAMAAGKRWAATIDRVDAGCAADRTSPAADRTGPSADPQPGRAAGLAALVALLDRLGFAPSTEPLGDRIYLHACPFADLARHDPAVVCGVHLGLLHGAVERFRLPIAIAGVTPFVRDDLCLIKLTEPAG